MSCNSTLMIGGAIFPCDWPTDERGKHKGWAHTNTGCQAIWGKDQSTRSTLNANVVPPAPADDARFAKEMNEALANDMEHLGLSQPREQTDPVRDGIAHAFLAEANTPSLQAQLRDARDAIAAKEAKIESQEQDVEHLLRQAEDRSKRMAAITDALRLTVEYVGTDMLPPVEGWSWFDALTKHAPAMLKGLVDEDGKGRIPLGGKVGGTSKPWAITLPGEGWEVVVGGVRKRVHYQDADETGQTSA